MDQEGPHKPAGPAAASAHRTALETRHASMPHARRRDGRPGVLRLACIEKRLPACFMAAESADTRPAEPVALMSSSDTAAACALGAAGAALSRLSRATVSSTCSSARNLPASCSRCARQSVVPRVGRQWRAWAAACSPHLAQRRALVAGLHQHGAALVQGIQELPNLPLRQDSPAQKGFDSSASKECGRVGVARWRARAHLRCGSSCCHSS